MVCVVFVKIRTCVRGQASHRSAEEGAPPRKGPGVSKWGLVGKAGQRRPRNRSSRQSRALNARPSAPLGEKDRAFATANWANATTGLRRQKRSHPRAPITAPFRTRKTDYSEKPGFLNSAEADPAPGAAHRWATAPGTKAETSDARSTRVTPPPSGAPRDRPGGYGSGRGACRAESWRCPRAQGAPGPRAGPPRPRAGAWQSCAAACEGAAP